jgi:hypothetical protein
MIKIEGKSVANPSHVEGVEGGRSNEMMKIVPVCNDPAAEGGQVATHAQVLPNGQREECEHAVCKLYVEVCVVVSMMLIEVTDASLRVIR